MTVEIILPSTQELDRQRRRLEIFYKKGDFDQIAKFSNINLVEKLYKQPTEDFLSYAIALRGNDLIREAVKLHSVYKQVSRPNPGDYVLYFNSNGVLPDVITHIGICLPGDRVLSKWGLVNVFDHPVYLVPESFGERVRFVSRP